MPNPRPNPIQDYVTVAERIEKFHAKFDTGRLVTHIIEHDAAAGFILMRADVYRKAEDEIPAATGHAYELKSEGYVQRTSYIEVCETSCVGRALAIAGFEVRRGISPHDNSTVHAEKASKTTEASKPETAQASEASAEDTGAKKFDLLRRSIKSQLDKMKGDAQFPAIATAADSLAYVNEFLAAESRDYQIGKISDIRDEDCEMVFNYLTSYNTPKV